jgi:hypothetical protein
MANEISTYRARPIIDGILNRLKNLYAEQRVVVETKNVFKSVTIIVNGVLFAAATIVSLLDIVFGANIIEPIVQVFTTDPDVATRVLTVVTQVYTVLNIMLRLKTTTPVTLKTETKEEAVASK